LIYRGTQNLRAVQLLLGYSRLDSTLRYLGIEVNDVLDMVEQTDLSLGSGRSAVVADRPL
jgi:site-specific recombinase XerD